MMRRKAIYGIMLVMAIALASCHSNEANYRAAYEKARERVVERMPEGLDEETYALIRAEQDRNIEVVNGDSVMIVRKFCNLTDEKSNIAKRYNVVVAQFKQIFNAKSMRDRLHKEHGYPSYLLFDSREAVYYVIVKAFDEKDVAVAFLKDLEKNNQITVLIPKLWILEKL